MSYLRKITFIFLFSICFQQVSAQVNTKVLGAFGGTMAVALYNTYVSIGSIADGYVHEIYDADYTIRMMDEQSAMMTTLDAQLQEMLDASVLDSTDKEYVLLVRKTLNHLKLEAEGVVLYINTDSSEQYSSNRESAWILISDLLDLE